MSSFEFVFSLFGLLLGLSLAEVLSGFVRAVTARDQTRLGWLTPMLGTVVMLDLTTFWSVAWLVRERVPPSLLALVIGLIVSGIYFFAASLIFPRGPEVHADLDDHYMAHRREVLLAIIVSNIVVNVALYALLRLPMTVDSFIGNAFMIPMAVAIGSRDKRINVAALLVCLLIYTFYIFGAGWTQG
jgi:formate/nitrite transporter FocA (FNT family)